MTVGGIILCGGQSRRMGRPKAWLPFGDELLLPPVVRLMRDVVATIVVVAAPDQELPLLSPGVEVVRDEERGRGPLQGFKAGLEAICDKADVVYLSSCDAPFLQPEFVRQLLELLGDHHICVPRVGEYFHPLAAVYRVSVLPVVTRLLAQDRLRPTYLFEEVPTRVAGEDELRDADPTFQTLRNLNTPEEYRAALEELSDAVLKPTP